MKVIKNDKIIYTDIDDTLVKLTYSIGKDNLEDDELILDYYGSKVRIEPNYELIEVLKQYKLNDCYIVAWSGAGAEWGEKIIKKLKLEKTIDLLMKKPRILFDDLQFEELYSDIKHIRPCVEENLKKYAQKDEL